MTLRPEVSGSSLEERAREAIADCVHCGFCLPACPTYVLWQREPDSPRGRIQLLDGWLRGRLGFDGEVAQRFDNCLGCLACVTACPSGVQYEHVIDLARRELAKRVDRDHPDRRAHERTVDWALRLFPYRRRLRLAAGGLVAYRGSGIGARLERSSLWRRLPRSVREMDSLAPAVGVRTLFARTPSEPAGAPRTRPRRPVARLRPVRVLPGGDRRDRARAQRRRLRRRRPLRSAVLWGAGAARGSPRACLPALAETGRYRHLSRASTQSSSTPPAVARR